MICQFSGQLYADLGANVPDWWKELPGLTQKSCKEDGVMEGSALPYPETEGMGFCFDHFVLLRDCVVPHSGEANGGSYYSKF